MEKEQKPQFTIRETSHEDVEMLRRMHAASWLANYPNEDEGVPYSWVKEVTDDWLTEEGIARSHDHFKNIFGNPDHYHRIATNSSSEIVGFIHGSRIEGKQRLEGLYLDTSAQGTGLAYEMTDELMAWFDPSVDIELEVIDYNNRAKNFYRKYGFEEVPGSKGLFKDKLPDVTMVRKGNSMMEHEKSSGFAIAEMTIDMMDEVTDMRLNSWLDTYVNNDAGVTREWIEARNAEQRSPEKQQSRIDRFAVGKANGTFNAWVALDDVGKVIGSTTPFVDDEGHQHVGSLYVDREWHGRGVASQLMQKVVNWLDPSKPIELGVVAYNERAKAFYRKWGFEEVPGSETLFAGKIPEIMMVRKGGADQ